MAFLDIRICPFYKEVDGIMLINPGSTFYGRRGSKKRAMACFVLKKRICHFNFAHSEKFETLQMIR